MVRSVPSRTTRALAERLAEVVVRNLALDAVE